MTTEKSYLIDFGDGHEVWLPISIIVVDENQKMVAIPTWLYELKFDV